MLHFVKRILSLNCRPLQPFRHMLLLMYFVLKTKVLEMLSNAVSGTLMTDGWTDKCKRLPYFAVRLSFIHEWSFRILTLSISLLESHTADSLSRFVKSTFSLLSAMAKVYLSLSPGSMPVESLFSTARLILNSKRYALSPHKVNMVCFVQDNYLLYDN